MIIAGTIENIIYRNSENGYTVLELFSGKRKITVSGKFPIVGIGEILELEGDYKIHPEYGEQFVAESVKVSSPVDENAIEKYLSCGLISGVGEVTAKNIVKKFGVDTLDVIEKEPHRLIEIRGISLRKANEIFNTYRDIKKMQEAVMFLQKYDISISTAVKIFDKYKNRTEEVLLENPYRLIEDIDGIGFKTADKIAMKLGIKFDSEKRLRAGLLFELSETADKKGSTVVFLEDLLKQTLLTLELDESYSESLENALVDLEISGLIRKVIYDEKDAIAISKYYSMEAYIARKLITLSNGVLSADLGSENDILQYEKVENIELHKKQKEAILTGLKESVAIITGGPGTGKTTIIKAILKILKNAKLKCMLMAPTGRAAKRMEEQTKEPASTVHRALEANFARSGKGFLRNETNPLDTDVIIIDEVSMLDVFLMSSLLKAVTFGTRIIMVGDKDQLPSVGAGNVLADIIASGKFKVVELTQIYRQSETSMIAQNAHKINNCEMPDLKQKSSDFFYSSTSSPEMIAKEVVSLVSERIPGYYEDISFDDIQVITPMKTGLAGAGNLNIMIQDKLNPEALGKKQIELHKRIFRVGDRIMHIVNNYDKEWVKYSELGAVTYGEGVFNGDTGKIDDINEDINEIYVTFDDGRQVCYSYAELEEIVLSYAITIHKSQGSEFPVVIIPIVGGSPLLMNKNLLYTAVTRAKKMVVLIGKSSNIYYMIMNKMSATRYTMLKKLLETDMSFNGVG